MERITSRTNPLLTHIRRLAASGSYRRQCGEYLGDSPKLLQEALLWKGRSLCAWCTPELLSCRRCLPMFGWWRSRQT